MTLKPGEVTSALARVPLFEGISEESMERLAAVTGEVEFEPGQFVVLQGQVGTGLYVIVAGSARVVRGTEEIARLGPDDFFGELSVIDQMPRNASVQAIEPTRCLALASWDLLDLLESDAKLSLNLIRGLAARVRGQGELHHH
ncbi:MAG: cyclic nucleotide-binding domain-containing protein [Candidatus Limnocylindrales bacterium]